MALLSLISSIGLTACSLRPQPAARAAAAGTYLEEPLLQVAAAFGPDGRLWRASQTKHHIYVDASADFGRSFTRPIAVNRDPQHIQSKAERRASIAVDPSGRIFVTYSVFGNQPWTTYFSQSIDGGAQFSQPVLLGEEAKVAQLFQSVIAVAPEGRVYVFWHDEREARGKPQLGNAVYYASPDVPGTFPAAHHKAGDSLCECCRLAVDFETNGTPVLLARFLYPDNVRDHGLLKPTTGRGPWESWRVTFDGWRIEACPEIGPALSIGPDDRYHIVWFTQGSQRRGLFYAHSTDGGRHFSEPRPLGDLSKLPNRPAVLSLGNRVFIAWKEFDGSLTQIRLIRSEDAGVTWSPARSVAESRAETDDPLLLAHADAVFLSWNTVPEGYRLVRLD